MGESRQKFVADFLLSTLPKIVSKSKGIILIPIITKIMGQGTYGIWTNFAIGLTLVASVASLSLGAATNRFLVDASPERLREEYWAIMVVTTISAIIAGGILILFQDPVAAIVFGDESLSILVSLFAGVLVFSLFTRQSVQFYRSQRRMRMYSGIQSIKPLGEITVIAIAAILFESIVSIIFWYLIFHIFLSTIMASMIIRDFGISYPNFARIDQYLKFGIPLVATGMMYWIVNVSDRYLITYFHNVDVTGGYAVVYATASALAIVSTAIGTVLFPDLTALRKSNNITEYRHRLSKVIEYFFIISIPATVGLIAVSDPLLRLLSSSEIVEYIDLMAILAPAMLLYGLFNILIQALLSDGRSRSSAVVWGGIAILNFGANLILVPRYAAMGASIATLGSFAVGVLIVGAWKWEDIILNPVVLGKVGITSLFMGVVVLLIQSLIPFSQILALPMFIGLGVTIYILIGFLTGFLTKQHVEFVKKIAQ